MNDISYDWPSVSEETLMGVGNRISWLCEDVRYEQNEIKSHQNRANISWAIFYGDWVQQFPSAPIADSIYAG